MSDAVTLFGPDRFHPSSAGYAVISDALIPPVLNAAAGTDRLRVATVGVQP